MDLNEWIIVHSKLAKIIIFLMCGAERADDLTDKDIPNSIKKCALENLKWNGRRKFLYV